MKISVIIPVFKAEKFIERCARSLMEQTMKDGIEFLFINDCTPDNSMHILQRVLEEYPERQNQIRIVENEKNLGVSATRKLGVREASGEYIGWCDADDWIEPEAFDRMYDATKQGLIDIVVAPFFKEKSGGLVEIVQFNHCHTPQECIQKSWQGLFFPGALWQQICRKELLIKAINKIIDTSYSEDIFTLWLVYSNSKSIAYISTPLYHYTCDNSLSLVHNINYSWDAWLKQKKNIEIIEKELSKKYKMRQYRIACNALKYSMKLKFRPAFPNMFVYYYTFRECYFDINKYLFTPSEKRFKTFLVYNLYPLFWFNNKKKWK